jgi:hypothetical protein
MIHLKEGVMLRGLLLKESLHDTSVLSLLRITRTETWQINNATADQPTTWTALLFEADAEQADLVSQALSRAIEPRGWYLNASTASRAYVIFPDRVFVYQQGDRGQRIAAREYARSLGIPESQLDWGE